MHFLADFQRFFDKIHFFSYFTMLITSQEKAVENAMTPHFVQNLALFNIVSSKDNFRKDFEDLKKIL